MESKQTASEFVNEAVWREKIKQTKQSFRAAQRNLSFDEKMKIAFALNERDNRLKTAKKK